MIDLKSHKTCIFGIQGSGKTFWAKQMYKHFRKPLVYVVNSDDGWNKLKGLAVWESNRGNIQADFLEFIKKAREWAFNGQVDLIIIDEADLFFRGNYDINTDLQDLVLNHRHMNNGKGVALWFMTRRPQDIPTKIVESSKFLIIFKLEGKNAIDRFRDIHPKIPGMIAKLDYTRHNYVFKEIGFEPEVHAPVSPPLKNN